MSDLFSDSPAQRAISVSELNRQAKTLLESGLPRLWVEGEVSNLVRPASGHLYFSLKDESAQLRCAWFRQRQRGPTINLKNGDQMLAFGRVSIYEARGDYQMIVEQLEDAGEGALRRRFEALKKKLSVEGLFDEEHKQELPTLPQRIGVVTSPTGAAVRDILSVLRRRFPHVPVIIYATAVQGEFATDQIVTALETAVARAECDVLIIGRGGGSLEDLWQFNEEAVARAIFACPIPTISAVGHEVDFTIADFVADVRAPTPSGAAELAVPDQAEWQRNLSGLLERLSTSARRAVEDQAQNLDWLSRRLVQSSPAATVARQRDWLRNLQLVLTGVLKNRLTTQNRQLDRARTRLMQHSPSLNVQHSIRRLTALRQRLETTGRNAVDRRQQRLRLAERALDSVSPLATLDRGYAILSETSSGHVIQDSGKVDVGDKISARLARGAIEAEVTSKDKSSQ